MKDYDAFIAGKRRSEVATGHNPGELNENLFDFQAAIVNWAVRRGRAAVFADTGLGKTLELCFSSTRAVWAYQDFCEYRNNV